jgi:5-methylcytosine-specific restriction endonuclease McrA
MDRHPFTFRATEMVKPLDDWRCNWVVGGEECGRRESAPGIHYRGRRSSLSLRRREAILRRDSYTCQLCGTRASIGLEVDHKVPVARGGTNENVNLWVLCRPCNQKKGTTLLDEMGIDVEETI